jgi:mono/diheme cytochrome c family protein
MNSVGKAVLAAAFVAIAGSAMAATPPAPDPAIARGKYLATAGDCVACHSLPGGQPFAGGVSMDTPFGTIYTPNITPDRATGIGSWTDDQFYHAFHDGISAHGEYLYPAFPFPWFTKVTRPDVMAIKAYLFSLPPVHAPKKPNHMEFPFNIREGLVAWRVAFFRPGEFKPDPKQSDELNRGAYLVQGLGHCGECHNQNNLFGAGKMAGQLEGGAIDNWYAPNITSNKQQGIGGWSENDLATYLKTGAAPGGAGVVLGPMAETIHDSLQYLTDPDIHAIAAYLKSTEAKSAFPETNVVPSVAGADVYLSYCASCHQQDGKGVAGQIPALAGNGAVRAEQANNIIRVVLGGHLATKGYAPMPAVGVGMTDTQIAAVANYIRTAWGNRAPGDVAPGLVAKLRGDTHGLLAANDPKGCPPTDQSDLAKAVSPMLQDVTEANMLERADKILPKARAAAPKLDKADLVNGLTAAYCPVVYGTSGLTQEQRASRLGSFAQVIYGQLTPSGQYRN